MGELVRSWFPKAATIWVDMERGLYDWQGKPPRNRDGSLRVVRKQILRDLGLSQKQRIWEHPGFLECLRRERARRDIGIADAVEQIEAATGPLIGIGSRIVALVRTRLDEDPDGLSTKELLQYGPAWVRLGLELEGRVSSRKERGIEHVIAQLARGRQVTQAMLDGAPPLVREYRELQDRSLAQAGIIEGEADG